jgi:alginate O-acetyltransferase complex protein AlgI
MTLLSFAFLVFLSIVFILYWTIFRHSAFSQNILLLFSSLVFYYMADWHFFFLLIFSILFNFYLALFINKNKTDGRLYLLLTGLVINILILSYFKYNDFFYNNWLHLTHVPGDSPKYLPLHIILPLGISFYTFQAIGYLIDVYNEQTEARRKLLIFATYISYFPKITAGPIEQQNSFFKQIETKREFSYDLAVEGLRQILWGLFAKLVIADNCAFITAPTFDNYHHLPASTLWMGAFFYVFQVYCDFSGYSNMAIGISKLFGIRLMRNFASPFFSVNISEFWKKWNISLSSWMMKYIFYPLSFTLRKLGKMGLIISILATFLIIGWWHGANPTFIYFGLFHGLYFIPIIVNGQITGNTKNLNSRSFPSGKDFFRMMGLFILVMITIILFGSDSTDNAFGYLSDLFSFSIFARPVFLLSGSYAKAAMTLFFIMVLLSVEWVQRNKNYELQMDGIKSRGIRWGLYYVIVLSIIFCGSVVHLDFIYSQF